jgi:hypothetical protein
MTTQEPRKDKEIKIQTTGSLNKLHKEMYQAITEEISKNWVNE